MNKIIYILQCSSTNDEILKFTSHLEQEQSFTLYTFNQTNGRGQYGNTWKILPEQNLAFSILFNSEKVRMCDNLFNFHTANILRKFIAKKTGEEVKVKWPNDLILFNKKISGMLIEKKKQDKREFTIVGIGVNILQEDFSDLPKVSSIFKQTSIRFELREWAEEMNAFLNSYLFENISENEILEEYNQHLFRKDIISVFSVKGERQNGIIREVDEKGFIWINLERDGLKKFYHKEIELLY